MARVSRQQVTVLSLLQLWRHGGREGREEERLVGDVERERGESERGCSEG